MLKFPTIFIKFYIFLYDQSVSPLCVLKFCYLVHMYIYLLNEMISYHYEMSFFSNISYLEAYFSDSKIATPALSFCRLYLYSFIYFYLSVFLYINISCKQYIINDYFLLFSLTICPLKSIYVSYI